LKASRFTPAVRSQHRDRDRSPTTKLNSRRRTAPVKVVRANIVGPPSGGDLYGAQDTVGPAGGCDGISIAPALETAAAVIILALPLACEALLGPKSFKRMTA
jgi:hypothetical protein